ncbi:hypothetical protein [Streptomyces sp. f150]|uniref:hypothetical protein n=1 Tax=Streptomyces sp. f150 TaxID=1827699 RepID=UPI000BF130BD|nr:hypothetical protein [Streptomyces sp. f150]
MTDTPMTPDVTLARLRQYGERTSTWSTATYNDGTEKALHQIAVSLAEEVERLRKALNEGAAWLVRAGYPLDWSAQEPPPDALREAVIDAVHADPAGTVHGGELTRDEVANWLAVEVRAFARPETESTP